MGGLAATAMRDKAAFVGHQFNGSFRLARILSLQELFGSKPVRLRNLIGP